MPTCRRCALYYIGGIIKHAKALNALTNPLTNSYKRLIPGFEAPVLLAYSARNRSASCRIPYATNPKAKRVEVRFPDPGANPYLAFAAMLMAGLDGIRNKIHPGDPMDKDLYDLPPEELKGIPTVCGSLREAIGALEGDHEFLLAGDVFSTDQIESYIELKWNEVYRFEHTPAPGRVRDVLLGLISQRIQQRRPAVRRKAGALCFCACFARFLGRLAAPHRPRGARQTGSDIHTCPCTEKYVDRCAGTAMTISDGSPRHNS